MRKIILSVLTVLAIVILCVSCSDTREPLFTSEISADIGTPSFSVPAGFYGESFKLEITNEENLTIRYTLDGSEPCDSSPVYKGPITISDRSSQKNDISTITSISTTWDYVPKNKISKATVVRAALFTDDGKRGESITSTYFVGLSYDALVVSIVADRDGLFSYENGIFVLGKRYDEWKEEVGSSFSNYGDWEYQGNFSLKGDEWERKINIEFFDDGDLCYSQTAGMRIAGAATRTYRQKSLRITARSQYGEKRFYYPLIPDNMKDGYSEEPVTEYRSFVLRNGGNDFDYARIRDPFIQTAVSDCSFSTQQTTPAVAFINGEYWGVYTLTEDYNERYIEENFGVDKDNVAIIKKGELEEGKEEDIDLFYDVHSYITSNDMSTAENYASASDMLDMTGFAQYCALHIYIGSEDGPFQGNNWRMWRAVSTSDAPYEDGKLRIMLYDTEFSLGLYDNGSSYDVNTFDILSGNTSFCGEIFNSLMSNNKFKELFISEFLKMRNVRFSHENTKKITDELFAQYEPIMEEHYGRYGATWMSTFNNVENLKGQINYFIKYLNGRYNCAPQLLCAYLDIDPDTSVIEASDGSVSIIY